MTEKHCPLRMIREDNRLSKCLGEDCEWWVYLVGDSWRQTGCAIRIGVEK